MSSSFELSDAFVRELGRMLSPSLQESDAPPLSDPEEGLEGPEPVHEDGPQARLTRLNGYVVLRGFGPEVEPPAELKVRVSATKQGRRIRVIFDVY